MNIFFSFLHYRRWHQSHQFWTYNRSHGSYSYISSKCFCWSKKVQKCTVSSRKYMETPESLFWSMKYLFAAHIFLKPYPFLRLLYGPARAIPFFRWSLRILQLPGHSDCSRAQHVSQFYQHKTFSETDTDVEEKFYFPRYCILLRQSKLGVASRAAFFLSENTLLHKGKQWWERDGENERTGHKDMWVQPSLKRIHDLWTLHHMSQWTDIFFFILV